MATRATTCSNLNRFARRIILLLSACVRGKVIARGFRMELIRIGCIEIDRRILEEPWRGLRRDS
jgi:hypothetical protein